MGKKVWYSVFVGLVLLLCLVPSLGMFLAPSGETGGNEVLADLPVPVDEEGTVNLDYFAQLTNYVEDNYFLRQKLVTTWSGLNEKLLHTSAVEDVVLGRDGWLYFGKTLPDYTGTDRMTEREIFSAARNLRLMQDYCESRGAKFLFTIAPNKNSLYPEYMPAVTIQNVFGNADLLAEAMAKEEVRYLDLFAAFRGEEEKLYFIRDSHWNSRGAALAADLLNEALGRSSDYFNGPFQVRAEHRSDLDAMLYPAGTWLEENPFYTGHLDFSGETPIRSPEDIAIRTAGGGEGSLLMFRDSFGNLLYPYLADSFERAQFSRLVDYRMDLVDEREADCVVVELVERNIRYLIDHNPVMPAPVSEAGEVDFLAKTEATVTREPAQALPGAVCLSGTLPDTPTAESRVYLAAGDNWYEACLRSGDGFSLCVPETVLEEELALVFTAEVGVVSFPVVFPAN